MKYFKSKTSKGLSTEVLNYLGAKGEHCLPLRSIYRQLELEGFPKEVVFDTIKKVEERLKLKDYRGLFQDV